MTIEEAIEFGRIRISDLKYQAAMAINMELKGVASSFMEEAEAWETLIGGLDGTD